MVSARFWERHLGSDALATMWLMSLVATLMEGGVLLLCWLTPSAKVRVRVRANPDPNRNRNPNPNLNPNPNPNPP